MEIKDLTGKLILRQHLGEGTFENKKIKTSITNNSLIIEIDNKQYGVSWSEIILECLKEINLKTKPTKEE